MLGLLKEALKKNRVTRELARRTRSFFSPLHHLRDLRDAWNRQFYEGADNDVCLALYTKNRDYQRTLAARRLAPLTAPKRYLGPEWVTNIGTLAHVDTYVKIGLLGWRGPQETILTAYSKEIGNAFFLNLWRKHCTVMDGPDELKSRATEIELLMDYHLVMELHGKPQLFQRIAAIVQQEWERQNRGPILALDEATKERGWDMLAKVGIPRDAWFVAVHVRENGFKVEEHVGCVRNAKIESYLPAFERITAAGGWVIRCGHPSMTPLPRMERVLDYAHSDIRSEWMDIFLASQSRFLIGTQSGLSHVGDVFGVPTLYSNWVTWGFLPWYGPNIIILKTYQDRQRRRALTLREIREEKLEFVHNPQVFADRGISVLDNPPDEIVAGVEEMLQATQSPGWHPGAPQRQVQETLAKQNILLNGRISEAFLAQHGQLIDPSDARR
jgi:putative glycosyltransferase (TIGR04372 family)